MRSMRLRKILVEIKTDVSILQAPRTYYHMSYNPLQPFNVCQMSFRG